jgi:uncharacterized membrane protein required for colicin V production
VLSIPEFDREVLVNLEIMFMLIVNIGMTIAYVMIKTKLKSLKRIFQSRFGLYSATLLLIFFCSCFASVVTVCDIELIAFPAVSVFLLSMTFCYYFFVMQRQSFSDEEKNVLFEAHFERSKFSPSSSSGHLILTNEHVMSRTPQ